MERTTSRLYWQVIVRSSLAAAVQAAARDVASRLFDQQCLVTASEQAVQQTHFPALIQIPESVAGGYAGLAILCAYLDSCFPAEGWDKVGHQHLIAAARAIEARPARYRRSALFSGLAGVAFASWSLSRNGKRYHTLLATLEETLLPDARAMAIESITQQVHGCRETLYDVISGLAGLGAYLLCHKQDPAVASTLQSVLEGLVYLSTEQDGLPRWHIPAHLAADERWQASYPDGYLNCGLAHGLPGPLALLALARLEGIEVAGIDEAIARTANWIIDHHLEDEWGINWPVAYPVGRANRLLPPSRTAWCYGIPGIARSLWLAGAALNDDTYREIACHALQTVYRRPWPARFIDSPSFCHGVAGLLHVTLRFAHETGDPLFFEAAQTVCEHLLDAYQPGTLLGYQHLETDGVRVDHPWLLDGAAGIVLVLLAASVPCEPSWDRLFLLS